MPLLLILCGFVAYRCPPYVFMWALCASMFFGAKLYTLRRIAESTPLHERLIYAIAWVGMDVGSFLAPRRPLLVHRREWLTAGARLLLGVSLTWLVARHVADPVVAAWTGMIGLLLVLHFGLFHLLALAWRARGRAVQPLMDRPLRSRSLAELWGVRWNRGFHQLAHRLVFRPLSRRISPALALLLTFAASGLVHDLIISLPARGGFGLPTLYFMIQGLGVLAERRLPRSDALRRAFTFIVALAPLPALFHPPFIHNVIVPFLQVVGAMGKELP